MFEFEKISFKQLLAISQVFSETSLLRREFIESKFSAYATNFVETVQLLDELGLIEVQKEDISLTAKYKTFLEKLCKSKQSDELLKSFIISCLLTSKASFSNYINSFFSKFELKNGCYEFSPTASQRLEYSGLRNFLIEIGLIYLNETNTKYTISDDYLILITDLQKTKQLSPDDLSIIQNRRLELGKAAEYKIIEYERQRLSAFPQLIASIEHVASENVVAGYDIKSFEDYLDKAGKPIPRFIEVKAVSIYDYGFYWSRNEIEEAKMNSDKYHLYLLPVTSNDTFDIANLKIIADPYSNIYLNTMGWSKREELLSFTVIGV